MGRRNFDAYTLADWRQASNSARMILLNRWPVDAVCDACALVMVVDVRRIVREVGPEYSFWGAKPRCRRKGCSGRVTFYLYPPWACGSIAMTARGGL